MFERAFASMRNMLGAISRNSGVGSRVGDLFGVSTGLSSLGLSVAHTLFDAGATRARDEGAEAPRGAVVAHYRQAVLTAFRAVEDQLSSNRSLNEQAGLRHAASEAADLTEQQLMNRCKTAQVSYVEVVTAQASTLNARRTVAQLAASRQAAAIMLIQGAGRWLARAGMMCPRGEAHSLPPPSGTGLGSSNTGPVPVGGSRWSPQTDEAIISA